MPGGKIEPGESAANAAQREIKEETGLDVELRGLLDLHDVIRADATGNVTLHYLICVFYGISAAGDPRAATDISDARFVTLDELSGYRMTDGAVNFIRDAHRRLGLD